MCGRAYATYTDEELGIRYLNRRKLRIPDFKPTYNFCPTQSLPVIQGSGIEILRWGLAVPRGLINIRSETLLAKRRYREALERSRVVVPLSGFFEWAVERPFAVQARDRSILSVAGVREGDAFAILTTAANSAMEKIHPRMPVILDTDGERLWLDPACRDVVRLQSLMKPCSASTITLYEISTWVNSHRNNDPGVLMPLGA